MSSKTLAGRLLGLPWPPLLAVVLILSLGVALVVRRAVPPRASDSETALTFLVSGDTQGLLYPHGCLPGQPGGLARRGEAVRQARLAGPVLYTDLGNAPSGDSPYDRVKFAAILRGERVMGVAAHNLGPAEVRLGAMELHRLAAELKAPFVSTNVRDSEGRPLAEPMRLVEIAGRRIAIVGLLSPGYEDASLKVLDPATALAETLAEHAPDYDLLLVLGYLSAEELVQLGSRLPEKAVLVGPSQSQDNPPNNQGANIAGRVGQNGTSIVRIDLTGDGAPGWVSRDVMVTAAIAEDSRQLANVEAYHRELAEHDFAPTATNLSMPLPPEVSLAQRVAGTHTCRACHAAECAVWDHSRHERAWQSLVDRGAHFDAACQRCHTTGYGWEGGFNSAAVSRGVGSVGCESCHGPSLAHEQNPAVRTPLVANQQCINCHDPDKSPGFDYAAAWARIQHGPSSAFGGLPSSPDAGSLRNPAGTAVN